ncbi:MAG: hypothetical protein KGL35_11435 [Bradyrhizobium sp.]|nr:hypothetical protein [Bradyrhizobium sp.]
MSSPMVANRVEWVTVTCPAGTLASAPIEVQTPIAQGYVLRVEVDIPDGHMGLTGIYLAVAGGRAVPMTDASWLIGNDRTFTWDLVAQLDSGAWSAFVYNTDLFSHSWFIRWSVLDSNLVEPTSAQAPIATPLVV